jgi:soluble lytic murein transglycosylase
MIEKWTERRGGFGGWLLSLAFLMGAAEAQPSDPPSLFTQALQAMEARDCPAALTALQAIPDAALEAIGQRAKFLTGYCLLQTARPGDALPLLEQAVTEYDLLADHATMYAAQAALALKDQDKAIALLSHLSARYPDSRLAEEAQFLLAKTFLDMGQPEAAERTLRAFLDRFSASAVAPDASLLLAKLFLAQERPEEAAPLLKRLYMSSPTDPRAVEAERLIEENPHMTPITSEERLLRAKALFGRERYSEAATALTPFLERDPDNREIRLLLGRSLFATREYPLAIATLLPLTDSAEPSLLQAEAHLLLGRALLRTGDTSQSIASLERIPAILPQSRLAGEALYHIGLNYEERGETDAALDAYARLLRLSPREHLGDTARWRRAWLHYREGRFRQAVQELVHLLEDYPHSPQKAQALYWRGRILEQLGEKPLAMQTYQRLLREGADEPYYLQAARQRLALKPTRVSPRSLPASAQPPLPAVAKARELFLLRLWEEAGAEYWEIAGAYPQDLPLQWEASEALVRANRFDRVVALARRTVRTSLRAAGHEEVLASFGTFLYPRGFWPWVDHYARETRLDPYLVTALIREESAFSPTALSRAGARGLMQLLPATAAHVAGEAGLPRPPDLDTPGPNIALGTRYLAQLQKEFGGDLVLALAAYNAGPHVVRRWLKNHHSSQDPETFLEEIPYPETRRYVKRVLGSYDRYRTLYVRSP